jgi:hypothetical protein
VTLNSYRWGAFGVVSVTAERNASNIGATTATVWLSGGTVGETYTIGCTVTTSMGRTCERSCRILVAER